MQSGNYKGKGISVLLSDIVGSGALFRGLAPGLIRSTLANGVGMVVFTKCKEALEREFGAGRESTF
jgi:hypothetical protein